MIFAALFLVAAIAASASATEYNNTPPVLPAYCKYPISGPNGEINLVCLPDNWNGFVVVYPRGYALESAPLDILWMYYMNPLTNQYLWDMFGSLGVGFATTSYHKTGMVVLEGKEDVANLIRYIMDSHPGQVKRVYILGLSMGGMITTHVCTEHPELVSACIVGCTPIGSFQQFYQYMGDIRALFDYFYPGVLPGDFANIPQELMDDWLENIVFNKTSVYVDAVTAAVKADEESARQMFRMLDLPPLYGGGLIDVTPESMMIHALTIGIEMTMPNQRQFGCQPYDNTETHYHGSWNDYKLNKEIKRYARTGPENCLDGYDPSALLEKPFVFLNTLSDPVVGYEQLPLYRKRVGHSGSLESVLMFTGIPSAQFGHCNFGPVELVVSLAIALVESMLLPPLDAEIATAEIAAQFPGIDMVRYHELNDRIANVIA